VICRIILEQFQLRKEYTDPPIFIVNLILKYSINSVTGTSVKTSYAYYGNTTDILSFLITTCGLTHVKSTDIAVRRSERYSDHFMPKL